MPALQKKTKAQIKKDIISFLDKTSGGVDPKPGKYGCGMLHRNALVLATSYNDTPRATVLEFFNEGLFIYIFGEPGGKIANLKRNPKASAVVYEQPLDHGKFQRSLQIFGTVELISVRNNPKLFNAKTKKWNLISVGKKLLSPMLKEKNLTGKAADETVIKFLSALNIIKIIPQHIILKEYHPDFSMHKYEWKK
jgi:pyridoxine/pyridoxamine 5'-phosphate oxidase